MGDLLHKIGFALGWKLERLLTKSRRRLRRWAGATCAEDELAQLRESLPASVSGLLAAQALVRFLKAGGELTGASSEPVLRAVDDFRRAMGLDTGNGDER